MEIVNEVFATLVPTYRHNEPEIIHAKHNELDNWIKYSAFEVVDDNGQERISAR